MRRAGAHPSLSLCCGRSLGTGAPSGRSWRTYRPASRRGVAPPGMKAGSRHCRLCNGDQRELDLPGDRNRRARRGRLPARHPAGNDEAQPGDVAALGRGAPAGGRGRVPRGGGPARPPDVHGRVHAPADLRRPPSTIRPRSGRSGGSTTRAAPCRSSAPSCGSSRGTASWPSRPPSPQTSWPGCPTVMKSWTHPETETVHSYIGAVISMGVVLLTVTSGPSRWRPSPSSSSAWPRSKSS